MEKMRVYELAAASGMTSKQVIAELASMNEYVRCANSTVEVPIVRRFQETHPPTAPAAPRQGADARAPSVLPYNADPSDPLQMAMMREAIARREPSWEEAVWKQQIEAETKVVPKFELDLDPITDTVLRARHLFTRSDGSVRRGELQEAQKESVAWHEAKLAAATPLDDTTICEWIRLHYLLSPAVMLAAVSFGLTPRLVSLKLWFGENTTNRRRLIDDVVAGDKSMETAAQEIRSYLANRETAPADRRDHA